MGVASRAGREPDAEMIEAARDAGQRGRAEVGATVHALLDTDIDEQRTNPLSILRGAVRYPTQVLHDAGVPEARAVTTSRFTAFPDDVYDLTPATWADIDPALQARASPGGRGRPTPTSAVVGIGDRPAHRHPCSRLEKRQPSGHANGASSLTDSRHFSTRSPVASERVE